MRGEFRPDGVEREWCDTDVLRQLRRRSLAVAPQGGRAGRARRPWPGSCPPGRASARVGGASTALVEALGVLQGAAIPASTLDRDVLRPAGPGGYRPADLDALCTSGDLVWIGAGGAGRRATAGCGCSSATRSPLLARRRRRRRPTERRAARRAARAPRRERGACFWTDLLRRRAGRHRRRAAGRPVGPRVGRRGHQRLAGARAGLRRAGPRPSGPAAPAAGRRGSRPRPGRLTRLGPALGRRALVAGRAAAGAGALAHRGRPRPGLQLLERHGVLDPRGGAGRGRRGRVRRASTACSRCWRSGARCGGATSWPGWARPSSPCPAPSTACGRPASADADASRSCWPPPTRPSPTAPRWRGPTRPAGVRRGWPERCVVLVDGEACAPGSIVGATTCSPSRRRPRPTTAGSDALVDLVKDGRVRSLEVRKIDGEPAGDVAAGRARCGRSGSPTGTGGWCCGARPRRSRRPMTADGPAVLSSARCPRATRSTGRPRRCGPALLGKSLTAFEAPRLVGMRPSIGAVIERVESRGKHLEIGFDDGVRAAHPHADVGLVAPVPGRASSGARAPRQARVIIEVPGWQAVCFSAPVVRDLPGQGVPAEPPARQPRTRPVPSPTPTSTSAWPASTACVEPETTVAEVLLDQRIACGRRQRLQVRGALGRASCTRSPRSVPCDPSSASR